MSPSASTPSSGRAYDERGIREVVADAKRRVDEGADVDQTCAAADISLSQYVKYAPAGGGDLDAVVDRPEQDALLDLA
ncbi:MAG TPA: hypothetical protein DEP69_00565 [Acidimicrobiaceae bacterium]|nr:hypothetical protein [Acidimicrobiaceae bacterium]